MSDNLPVVPTLDTAVPTIRNNDYDVAMVIDGVVYEVLNVDGRGAARFLAQPTFVQVAANSVFPGWTYDSQTQQFSNGN
jgi:hypothetical protein